MPLVGRQGGGRLPSRSASRPSVEPIHDQSIRCDFPSLDAQCRQAYIDTYMRRLAFFISPELDAGLKALKAQHGTPEAETIRRALTAYLTEKGVLQPTPKGGAKTKKR